MLSFLGLVGGLGLLIVLTIRGMNLFIAAPLCALIVGLTGGLPIFIGDNAFVDSYMSGFAGFVSSWFFMFLLGSLFGKFMSDTGAADAGKLDSESARQKTRRGCRGAGLRHPHLRRGGVCGGLFGLPHGLGLFKDANLPRDYSGAGIWFGHLCMTSAGSPEIKNWIPIKYLGTSPFAAWEVS